MGTMQQVFNRTARTACVLVLVAATGCTVNLEDKRITPEAIAQAFQQRDAVLELFAKKLSALEEQAKEEAK